MVYRFGVIGAGMIGYWHAEAIRRLPNADPREMQGAVGNIWSGIGASACSTKEP